MDYKARFYSSYLNHFSQPDTIVPNPLNPQSFNRYSYVRNNPINFNDPTGHIDCSTQYDPDCGDTDEQGELIAKPTRNYKAPNKDENQDLADIIGLDKNSDLACTTYSCSVDIPGVCPLGETCWVLPDYWDLNPKNPDYRTTTINGYFIALQITEDRYGQSYFSVGGSTSFFGVSYTNGAIGSPFDDKIPSWAESKDFLTGPAINITGSVFFGVGSTGSPGVLLENGLNSDRKPYAFEGGVHVTYPSISISGTFGWAIEP